MLWWTRLKVNPDLHNVPIDADWLLWVNKPFEPTPLDATNRYVFGFKTGYEETIQQEIQTEVDSGELQKLLKEGVFF